MSGPSKGHQGVCAPEAGPRALLSLPSSQTGDGCKPLRAQGWRSLELCHPTWSLHRGDRLGEDAQAGVKEMEVWKPGLGSLVPNLCVVGQVPVGWGCW